MMETLKTLKDELAKLPNANQLPNETDGRRKHLSSLRTCLRNISQDQAESGSSASRIDIAKELRFVRSIKN